MISLERRRIKKLKTRVQPVNFVRVRNPTAQSSSPGYAAYATYAPYASCNTRTIRTIQYPADLLISLIRSGLSQSSRELINNYGPNARASDQTLRSPLQAPRNLREELPKTRQSDPLLQSGRDTATPRCAKSISDKEAEVVPHPHRASQGATSPILYVPTYT